MHVLFCAQSKQFKGEITDIRNFEEWGVPLTWFTYLVRFPSPKRQSGKDRIGRGCGNPAQKTHQFVMTLDTWLTVQVVLNWNDVSPCYTAVYKFNLTFVRLSYTKAIWTCHLYNIQLFALCYKTFLYFACYFVWIILLFRYTEGCNMRYSHTHLHLMEAGKPHWRAADPRELAQSSQHPTELHLTWRNSL